MTKVSVIIPIYNMEKYLRQCLDSVCTQTLREIEIFCIDDGSSDSSEEILKEYQSRDPRIRVRKQSNQGVSAARNNGIRQAQGKYVIFMDPDDWYPSEDVLEALYQGAEKYQVPAAGGTFMDYHDGIYNETFPDRYFGYHFEKEGIIEYSDYQFDFGYQRFLFDRELLLQNQIFFKKYIRYQDPPFFVAAMIHAKHFCAVDKPAYCYRYGHTQISWNRDKVCDLLRGISENLDMSREHRLGKLHNLTIRRLNEEYRQLLGDSIFYEDYALDVVEQMIETLQHVDPGLLDEENGRVYAIYGPVIARVREDVRMHVDRIEDLWQRVHQLEAERDEACRREAEISSRSEAEIQDLNRRIEEVYRSFSYRVGHAVTILPRFLARLVRR